MTCPAENNNLINLNHPDDQPRRDQQTRDMKQADDAGNPEVVIGSNVIIDPDTVQIKTLGYKWEVDAKNKRDILPGKKFISGDWFRSPIAHVIAFLIFVVGTWYLVSWLGPIPPVHLADLGDHNIRGPLNIIFICLLPSVFYLWFLTN